MSTKFKCPHCGSEKGTWFDRTLIPRLRDCGFSDHEMAFICEDCGKDIDEPVKKDTNELIKEGKKFDEDKPQFNLLSTIALTELVRVLTFGAKKYDAHNWRKGLAWSRLLGAILRHIFAFLGGEDKDPETGLSHLAHAMCGLMFLLEFEITRRDLDDRYKAL